VEALRAPGAAAPEPSELEASLVRALGYLRRAGDPHALRHAEALLGLRPVREVEDALAARATDAAADPRLAAELFRELAELRALRGPAAGRLARALEATQDADGAWRSPLAPADPDPALPPFLAGAADPIHLTALIAGSLALAGVASEAALEGADAWIALRWRPELAQSGSWHGLSALFHFFASAEHELADEAFQWCGRELERAFRTRAIGAAAVGQVFVLCAARALPGARLAAAEVARAVLDEQAADGGWPAPAIGDGAENAEPGVPSGPSDARWTAHAIAALIQLSGLRPASFARALAGA